MRGVVGALALALAARATLDTVPAPRALDRVVLVPQNGARAVRLEADVRIPDGGELHWPIVVPHTVAGALANVSVRLRAAYHTHPQDLIVELRHSERRAELFRGARPAAVLGRPAWPRQPSNAELVAAVTDETVLTGTGSDVSFRELMSPNLAFAPGVAVRQSSTLAGADPERAIDGDVDGFFSRGSVAHTDAQYLDPAEPFWELDLDVNATVRTVRVWARDQEPDLDEIQTVRVVATGQVRGGSFRLRFDHLGVATTTAPISVLAVPMRSMEVAGSALPGSRPGESVQSVLEAIPEVGSVAVRRSNLSPQGGYTWTITFQSRAGNVPELTLASEAVDAPAGDVLIHTVRNGSSNVFYNYDATRAEVRGHLFPAWVLLSPTPFGPSDDLATAQRQAVWKHRITEADRDRADPRQILLRVRVTGVGQSAEGVVAQFVRLQREDASPLAVAEVEVFEERYTTLDEYLGGSTVPSGSEFVGQTSLHHAFETTPAAGTWVLSIRDTTPRVRVASGDSRPDRLEHGAGALSSWTLELGFTDGRTHIQHADVAFELLTVPVFGRVFQAHVLDFNASEAEVQREPSLQIYRGQCYGSCANAFGVGPRLTTQAGGDAARPYSRVTQEDEDHWVILEPVTDYLGPDSVAYRACIGAQCSSSAQLRLSVRKCRGRDADDDPCRPDGAVPNIVALRSDV